MGRPEHPIPMKGGGEYDALTGWRKVLNMRPRYWKKKYRRRFRRLIKRKLNGREG